jgi:hypothetical protein
MVTALWANSLTITTGLVGELSDYYIPFYESTNLKIKQDKMEIKETNLTPKKNMTYRKVEELAYGCQQGVVLNHQSDLLDLKLFTPTLCYAK